MIELRQDIPAEELFRYMEKLDFPSQYHPDFARWEASFSRDVDGAGRTLFAELAAAGAYIDGRLAGYVRRFDTDTALGNAAAQRLYEKTGFVRAGVTRSYVRDEEG